MRNNIELFFLLILSAILSSAPFSGYGAKPDIQFERKSYDLGEVNQGERPEYHFRFENVGTELLEIEKVVSSCGCAAALATTDKVEPGGSGEIKVTFKSAGYVGRVSKWVYVHSNDPDEPKVKLNISCTVVVDILVRPASLNFGKVQAGEEVTQKFTLLPMKLEEFQIEQIETSSPNLKYHISEYTENRKDGFQIQVTLTSEMPIGKFSEALKIQTDSEKHPVINVNITGQVRGDVWATPEEVAFGCHRGNADTLEITINKGRRENFLIVRVEDNIDHIGSVIDLLHEEGTQQTYTVTFQVDPDAPTGFLEKTLDFYTLDGSEPVVRLPLYVFIH